MTGFDLFATLLGYIMIAMAILILAYTAYLGIWALIFMYRGLKILAYNHRVYRLRSRTERRKLQRKIIRYAQQGTTVVNNLHNRFLSSNQNDVTTEDWH